MGVCQVTVAGQLAPWRLGLCRVLRDVCARSRHSRQNQVRKGEWGRVLGGKELGLFGGMQDSRLERRGLFLRQGAAVTALRTLPPGAGRGIPPCHLVKISRWKSDGNVPTEMLSLLGGGVIQCVPPSSAQVSKGKPDVNNTTF